MSANDAKRRRDEAADAARVDRRFPYGIDPPWNTLPGEIKLCSECGRPPFPGLSALDFCASCGAWKPKG